MPSRCTLQLSARHNGWLDSWQRHTVDLLLYTPLTIVISEHVSHVLRCGAELLTSLQGYKTYPVALRCMVFET